MCPAVLPVKDHGRKEIECCGTRKQMIVTQPFVHLQTLLFYSGISQPCTLDSVAAFIHYLFFKLR